MLAHGTATRQSDMPSLAEHPVIQAGIEISVVLWLVSLAYLRGSAGAWCGSPGSAPRAWYPRVIRVGIKMPVEQILTIGDLFDVVREWEQRLFAPGVGFPSVWYRGHADRSWELLPTVLRSWFIRKANEGEYLAPPAARVLQRERTINRQFRLRAASLLPAEATLVDIYFLAQHHGMPTRLLDWTTNALIALFFAVNEKTDKDGEVLVISPREQIPLDWGRQDARNASDVVDMRDSLVLTTVTTLFGEGPRAAQSFILPVAPDQRTGRIFQQSSRFTLHMPPVLDAEDRSVLEPHQQLSQVTSYLVPHAAKSALQIDLRRAGVDFGTVFADLDNHAREVRTAWKLYP